MNINELRTERDQLAARIAEIDALIAAEIRAATSTYTVTETTSPRGSTMYHVVRTDGTEDRRTAVYHNRRDYAELHAEFCERTPAHYRISLKSPPSSRMDNIQYWEITGSRQDDPQDLHFELKVNHEVRGDWPEGTRIVDMLVRFALKHEDGTDARITAKAEADAIEAAEATVREARAAQRAEAEQAKGPLATERQVEFIMTLLQQRERSGEGGGFYSGPTDRAGVEMLSKAEASTYITSLKGDY